jgi:hypothetical protein
MNRAADMPPIATRSQNRNLYITMFDSSQEQIVQDDIPDAKTELTNRLEKVGIEREKVMKELGESNRQLRIKNREVIVLKRKIELLSKQKKVLNRYKEMNKTLEINIKDKKLELQNIKIDFERRHEEREREMKRYIENNNAILFKLQHAQDTNRTLRSAYDDLFKIMEGYRNTSHTENISACLPNNKLSLKTPYVENCAGSDGRREKPNLFIIGDNYARGMGSKLHNKSEYKIQCFTKPNARIQQLKPNISNALNCSKKSDIIALVTGNCENSKYFKYYLRNMHGIIEDINKQGILLYITTILLQ